MKSPANLWSAFINTWKRFPWALGAVYVATILAFWAILLWEKRYNYAVQAVRESNSFLSDNLVEMAWTGVLGFFIYYTLRLIYESKKIEFKWQLGINLGVFGLLMLFYFFGIDISSTTNAQELRLVFLYLSVVVLAMFGPFLLVKNKESEMVAYIFKLLGRIFLGVIFFGILFVGLLLIGGLVDYLFGSGWGAIEDFGFEIWLFLAGFFATVYVLNGVPKKIMAKINEELPKNVELVVSYILIPVALVFLMIVYFYLIKSLVVWEWPKNGVAEILMSFGLVGIVTYLANLRVVNRSILNEVYQKSFFWLLLPLVFVLFLGIGERIGEYGLTANRALVVAFGVMELVIAFYYLISKEKRLKYAAVAALITILVALYSPANIFVFSKASQWNRFLDKLEAFDLVEEDKLVGGSLNYEDYQELNSIVNYLTRDDEIETVIDKIANEYGNVDFFVIPDTVVSYERLDYFFDKLDIQGTDYNGKKRPLARKYFHGYVLKDNILLDVKDYDYVFEFDLNKGQQIQRVVDGQPVYIQLNDQNSLELVSPKNKWSGEYDLLSVPHFNKFTFKEDSLIDDGYWRSYFTLREMQKTAANWRMNITVYDGMVSLNGDSAEETKEITSVRGYLLLQE